LQLRGDPRAADRQILHAEGGGHVQRHAVAKEVVDALGVGAGQPTGEVNELGVATAHAATHDVVVAGGVGLVLEHQVVAV